MPAREGWDAFDMLDVSLLLASALLGPVAEASGAPAHPATSLAQVLSVDPSIWSPATPRAVDLSRLSGGSLFGALAALPSSSLESELRGNPQLVSTLLSHPPSASRTAEEWRSMPASSRQVLERVAPRLVGSLEGIPYADRDRANRTVLTREIASVNARLDAGAGRAVSADLQTRQHMLLQIRTALASTNGLHRELIAFDASGQGRAVIGIGDVDHADYVGFLVPGMYYGVDARIVPWTNTAASIATTQAAWLATEAGPHQTPKTSAVISWIGYETPTLVDVASMTDARRGGAALVDSLAGLRAVRSGSVPYVSLLAHSYGATAAMLAVGENGTTVDALAVVGSPGSPVSRASDLAVRNGNVWVGAAAWDPIAQSGVFGSQPTSSAYGAQAMGVSGGTDPSDGSTLVGTLSHNDYFSPGSETVRNFALIGIGADASVLRPDGRTVAAAGR